MKKIPYGTSNFESIIRDNCFFIDKTKFIEKIESLGSKYLFFLRPRRFGKSLFLSILEHYYDIKRKDEFDFLFKDTYIGKNPTKLRNSFPILKFNFSGIPVSGEMESIERYFSSHIRNSIRSFFRRYRDLCSEMRDVEEYVISSGDASGIMDSFISNMYDLGIRYYLLIDEYDNFANNILMEHGKSRYRKATHAGGFLRSFFAVIKNGTENRVIERMFVVGVSPLVLSDITSGMNIGHNISGLKIFSNMIGITEEELDEIFSYYMGEGGIKEEDEKKLRAIIEEYSGNYRFSERDERIYNTDMVLYIIHNYILEGEIPRDIIDPNIRTDYEKLRFLVIENRRVNGNFNILQEVVDRGETRGGAGG